MKAAARSWPIGEAAPVPGQCVEAAPGACVLRFPLPPSLPIPLHVAAPEGVRLVTWAFAGLDAAAPDGPIGLLALEADHGSLGESLILATHFRDLAIRPERASPDSLRASERTLLARALLSAGPTALAPLERLFGLVETAVAALPTAADAPDLADAAGGWTLGGTAIPHGLLFGGRAGWGCARVLRTALGFGPHPRQRLTLAPLWGAAPQGLPERAFALHAHGFTTLATGAA